MTNNSNVCHLFASFDQFSSFLTLFLLVLSLVNGNDNDSDRNIWKTCDDNFYCDEKGLEMNKKKASWPNIKNQQICLAHLCRPLSYQEIISPQSIAVFDPYDRQKKKGRCTRCFAQTIRSILVLQSTKMTRKQS